MGGRKTVDERMEEEGLRKKGSREDAGGRKRDEGGRGRRRDEGRVKRFRKLRPLYNQCNVYWTLEMRKLFLTCQRAF